ncbi:transport-associated protein [Scytonema sp. HK-05]|uniref:BON domain-containing protein n=1 Tax=Scytonema sp. HK-05 TaxID=1137095 RepID=UPI0009375480|nr:BON domain-containing protein [Scytonema sp. HK-05]OKH60037.1 transporter [Scytonema sp. HK-05]BAY42728.1 transport-associated protein [Scytonema sp. HK-05]
MKKLTPFLISCVLVFGATACQNPAKTTADAPDTATKPVTQAPSPEATEAALKDAQSETRRNQLNADIRAREQRNNTFNDGKATNRSPNNLESEVRSKLEANIPNGHLTIAAAEDGTVTVSGTVVNKDQIAKIDRLAKEIKGVKQVINKATVAQTKS